jgi:hypothetical protein
MNADDFGFRIEWISDQSSIGDLQLIRTPKSEF